MTWLKKDAIDCYKNKTNSTIPKSKGKQLHCVNWNIDQLMNGTGSKHTSIQ